MTELGEIPEEWKIKKIKDIANICYGRSQKEVEVDDGKYKILGTGGVIGYTNDFLWNKPSVLIGRKGTIDEPQYIEEPFWTVDTLFYTKINENYIAKWFYYYLDNIDLKKYNEATGVPSLSVANLNTIRIATPTIKEQEKIASILSTIDEQIGNVDAIIWKNKELKKGLMQTLLTKGIGHTKFKKTEIGEIPEEWEVFSLMQISYKIGDGLHGTPKYDENGEYYFINGNNLVDGNIIVTQDTKKVSKEEYIKNNKELNDNSLLISLNGTIGNIAYYNDERIMLSKSSGYITLNDKCNKAYIYQLLQSSRINEYFNKELTGTTIKNLSLNTLRNTPISIPSIKEQEQIASILSEADKKIEKYKNRKQKLKEIKKGLMQQLLTGRVRVN